MDLDVAHTLPNIIAIFYIIPLRLVQKGSYFTDDIFKYIINFHEWKFLHFNLNFIEVGP